MTDLDTAWLAGLLEGEGCFHVRTDDGRPLVKLNMCDEDVIAHAAQIMETTYAHDPVIMPNHRDQYVIYLTGDRALRVMRDVLPYMGTRRAAAIQRALDASTLPLF